MEDNVGDCHSQNKSKEVSSVARPALAISSSQPPVSGELSLSLAGDGPKNAKMEEPQKKEEVHEEDSARASPRGPLGPIPILRGNVSEFRVLLHRKQYKRESPLEDYGIYDSVKSQLARGKGPKTQVSSTTQVTDAGASQGSSTTQVTDGGTSSSHATSGS